MSRHVSRRFSLLLLYFSFTTIYQINCERMSGLYVDNGYDQTVIHRVVSQREKRQVEHEILNLLGLPDRPPKYRLEDDNDRHHHNSLNVHPPQVRRSAPKFLLDIYKNALANQDEDEDNNKLRRKSEFGLSGQDLRAIEQSDVIMTFAAHNRHVPGVRHERGKRFWFDVSEVPENERLLGSELRLYRSLESAKSLKNHGAFTLTAYRVLRLEDGERELQYLDSRNASADHNGWISLNVSSAMIHWLSSPTTNRGLYLSVHPADRHYHEMKPEDIGIIGFKGPIERQPFMVGFFKSNGVRGSGKHHRKIVGSSIKSLSTSTIRTRTKRETKKTKGKKSEATSLENSYRSPNPYNDPLLPPQTASNYNVNNNTKTCKIQTLYVSFRDLQWQDWIIAPDGYDAYYCSGECNFPLNAHMNATNHAIVQTLVHLVNPGKVPKPCCAPTKLSPISVLYFMDESNVILKKYKNMVVKSCGCH